MSKWTAWAEGLGLRMLLAAVLTLTTTLIGEGAGIAELAGWQHAALAGLGAAVQVMVTGLQALSEALPPLRPPIEK